MFIRGPITWPPRAVVNFQVRYGKGRKPFPNIAEARDFAKAEREAGGWAAIDQVGTLEIEAKAFKPEPAPEPEPEKEPEA